MTGNVVADARNRAKRTFWQGLGVDVVAALAVLVLPLVTSAQSWADFDWRIIGFLVTKTLVATVLSYAMRAYVDPYRAIRRTVNH